MSEKIDQIYDKMFKRILLLSNQAVISLINGLFGTNHPTDSTVTYNSTEHVDDKLKKTLADTIITINHMYSYHLEAQTYEDDSIIFRVFDYGYHHAVKNKSIANAELTFPEPIVIYLASGFSVPNTYSLKINFGTQGSFLYTVPTCNFITMTPEEIERKNLIILLPFYLLKLRDVIKKERSPANLQSLINLIFNDILNVISKQRSAGLITSSDAVALKELLVKLYNHLYADYDECKKGGLNALVENVLVLDCDILEQKIDNLKDELLATERMLFEKERSLKERDTAISEKDAVINEKDKIIILLIQQLRLQGLSNETIASQTGLSLEIVESL